MIEKNQSFSIACGCCMLLGGKLITDNYLDEKIDGTLEIVIVYRCPACEKLSKARFRMYGFGLLATENGYTIDPPLEWKP